MSKTLVDELPHLVKIVAHRCRSYRGVQIDVLTKRNGVVVRKNYHNTNFDFMIHRDLVNLLLKHGLCEMYGFRLHLAVGFIRKDRLENAERKLKIAELL